MADGPVSQSAVEAVLAEFLDPETGRSVVQQGQVRDVAVAGNKVSLTLALTTHSAPLWESTRLELAQLLKRRFAAVGDVEIRPAIHERPPAVIGEVGLACKTVIAVGSGKGGVGKSTIAASLAYGLHKAGAKVGLMDADIFGPSIPHLVGIKEHQPQAINGKAQPANFDGIKVISIGYFVPPEQAVVWRGPMVHRAIHQFLHDIDWGPLDYLIIDMPPGTGDVPLSLSQALPLTGAVIVCTPQDVALLDAVKAISMFRTVKIPVLGMVENMSFFLCPDNGKKYHIFGEGGAKRKAAEMNIPFLGEVPLNMQIRINGDEGQLAGNFIDEQSRPYLEAICQTLVKNLAAQNRSAPPLPTLSVL